jgi:hypothetical protein
MFISLADFLADFGIFLEALQAMRRITGSKGGA